MPTNNMNTLAIIKNIEAMLQSLPEVEVQSVEVEPAGCKRQIDVDLLVRFRNHLAHVLVDVRQSAYPRDLRETIWQLQRHLNECRHHGDDLPTLLMVAARSISPSGRELLRKSDVGYWEEGGSLYLKSPWTLFLIDRPPYKKAEGRQLRSLYRGSAAQVLHALLLEPNKSWHVHNLAERAEVSPYTVHHVFEFLEAQLWVEKQGTGPKAVRVLREPGPLLDAWAEEHPLAKYQFHRFHRWTQSPQALRKIVTDTLDKLRIPYALTLASGAELVAPFATDRGQLSVIVPADVDIEGIAKEAGLKPVEDGETVQILAAPDRSPLLFRQQIDDVWVASSIQLYLDLYAWPKRGKEQAKHLRSMKIPY